MVPPWRHEEKNPPETVRHLPLLVSSVSCLFPTTACGISGEESMFIVTLRRGAARATRLGAEQGCHARSGCVAPARASHRGVLHDNQPVLRDL